MDRAPADVGAYMELTAALDVARATSQSILTTIRRNGRPQISNVLHVLGADGLIRISTQADRAKVPNLRREPWVALHVNGENFFSYVVIEGTARLSAVAQDPTDAAVEELVELYRSAVGDHPDWDEFRRAMITEQRVVIRIEPTRAYGIVQ